MGATFLTPRISRLKILKWGKTCRSHLETQWSTATQCLPHLLSWSKFSKTVSNVLVLEAGLGVVGTALAFHVPPHWRFCTWSLEPTWVNPTKISLVSIAELSTCPGFVDCNSSKKTALLTSLCSLHTIIRSYLESVVPYTRRHSLLAENY